MYVDSGAALGALFALDILPGSLELGVIAVFAIASVLFRQLVLHDGPWSAVDLAATAAFLAAFLPIAFVLGHWPFR
jgi:hypothetical protein